MRIRMRIGEVFCFEGDIALYSGGEYDRTRPQSIHRARVARYVPAVDWQDIIGQDAIWSFTGKIATVYGRTGRRVDLVVEGFEFVEWAEPEPRPRNGATYTWRWDPDSARALLPENPNRHGGWVREKYPHCRECNVRHSPSRARALHNHNKESGHE